MVLVCTIILSQIADSLPAPDSIYFRYEPVVVETLPSGTADEELPWTIPALPDTGRLRVSGRKDFSFDLAQGFDQGLRVDISGRMDDLKITGSLSDQAVPEATTSLSDIDKILLTAQSRRFFLGLGDQSLTLPFGIADDIQGGVIKYSPRSGDELTAGYAINRGTYQRLELAGAEGKQGPYFVPAPLIPGSERIQLIEDPAPPRELARGVDYFIDPEQGILAFTNEHVITSRTRIIVECLTTQQEFPNVYAQINGAGTAGPATVQMLARRTRDDRGDPLGFTFSAAEIESLRACGDSARYARVWADTSRAGAYDLDSGRFVYRGPGQGTYNVTFHYAGEGQGEYTYDPGLDGFVYAGTGLGNYTPRKRLPLPELLDVYGFSAGWLNTGQVEFLMSDRDRNSFSTIDDEDNRGSAVRAEVARGVGPAWINGRYLRLGETFVWPGQIIPDAAAFRYRAGDTLWELGEAEAGLRWHRDWAIEAGYGIRNRDETYRTVLVRPWWCYAGWREIAREHHYLLGAQTRGERGTYSVDYDHGDTLQVLRFDVNYEARPVRFGARGDLARHEDGNDGTVRLEARSVPLVGYVGQRRYGDTTMTMAGASVNVRHAGLALSGSAEQSQQYAQLRDDYYETVPEGTGNYAYDSATGTYLPQEGGDYVRRVVLLPSFTRVSARRADVDVGYRRAGLDMSGRVGYVDEESFFSHTEDMRILRERDDLACELAARQEVIEDDRYAFDPRSGLQREVTLRPRLSATAMVLSAREQEQRTMDLVVERRIAYRGELSHEFFDRPLVKPHAALEYDRMTSDHYPGQSYQLRAPEVGILYGQPVRRSGRAEAIVAVRYNQYEPGEVPFLFRADQPTGLVPRLTVSMNLGLGSSTVFTLVYQARWPLAEELTHNLNFQTRIRF